MQQHMMRRSLEIKCFKRILFLFAAMILMSGCSFALSQQADWSDRTRPIAFLSEREVQTDGPEPYLLLAAPDGSQVVAVKGVNRIKLGAPFTWRPDGNALAVMAYDRTTKNNCLMVFDAASQRCLVNDAGIDTPNWSPDGQWISFSRRKGESSLNPAGNALYLADAANGQVRKLIDIPYDPMNSISTWSPDSKQLAYEVHGESDWILLTSIDGSQAITMTQGSWPAWSPTGDQIAFVRSNKIWLYNLTDKTEGLFIDNPADAGAPAWSPDGQQLLFMSKRNGNWEIYRINQDGSNLTRLTNDPAWDGFPSWRPEVK